MEYSLQTLKEIASKLNIDYHPTIGISKLTEKIKEEAKEIGTTIEEVASSLNEGLSDIVNTDTSIDDYNGFMDKEIERLKKVTFNDVAITNAQKNESNQLRDAKKLKRVIITCNNKNKSGYQADIFSANNAFISETKCVALGVPTHISTIMYNTLKERKLQTFIPERLPNGNVIKRPKMQNEFTIEELPPLTREELEAIKKKQLAEGFTGE